MIELAASDIIRLRRLESTIQEGKQTFVSVGLALTEIRDSRLYRQHHKTFEDYCEKKWGWNRHRASQLINAAAVVEALPTNLVTMVTTERSARELNKVAPERRAEVLSRVVSKGPVTAKAIEIAVKPIREATIVHKDSAGYPIPRGCVEFWERRQEVQDLMTAVSRVKTTISEGRDSGDMLYRKMSQATIDQLSRTYQMLSEAKPYAVCLYCSGTDHTKKNCQHCYGTGMATDLEYKTASDQKLRRIREAGIRK